MGKITLDYVSSLNDDVEIALYDILGSQAHAIMLYENKIITKKEIKQKDVKTESTPKISQQFPRVPPIQQKGRRLHKFKT